MSIETRDFRNVVSGKIERNDPETFLGKEVDVYYRYNWALGIYAAAIPTKDSGA